MAPKKPSTPPKQAAPNELKATSADRVAEVGAKSDLRVAKIALGGVLGAAVIAGLFSLATTGLEIWKEHLAAERQAFYDKRLLTPQQATNTIKYLGEKTEIEKVGYYDRGGASVNDAKGTEDLEIIIHGNVGHYFGMSLISPGLKTVIVDKVWPQVDGWSECTLRNEQYAMLGYSDGVQKAFYLSEDFSEYPIIHYEKAAAPARLSFTGREVLPFDIWLDYEDYKLLFVSIHAEYRFAGSNEVREVVTKPSPIIDVANGNVGGCLELDRWWMPEMNKAPTLKSQSAGISDKLYAFLTRTPAEEVDRAIFDGAFAAEFREFWEARKGEFEKNTLFKQNAEALFAAYPA